MSLVILSRESAVAEPIEFDVDSGNKNACQRCLVRVDDQLLFFDRSLLDTDVVTETCGG